MCCGQKRAGRVGGCIPCVSSTHDCFVRGEGYTLAMSSSKDSVLLWCAVHCCVQRGTAASKHSQARLLVSILWHAVKGNGPALQHSLLPAYQSGGVSMQL
jgi:hypothetical protein